MKKYRLQAIAQSLLWPRIGLQYEAKRSRIRDPASDQPRAIRSVTSPPSLTRRARLAAAKAYHVIGIGLMLAVFGFGSVVLSGLVLPIYNLGRRDSATEIRAQRSIQWVFAIFLKIASGIGIISVNYRGIERLAGGPYLVVANHPTLLDVVLLGALFPQCDCVVKAAALDNFFLRGIVTEAGYVISSDGPTLVRECTSRLLAGRSVLLFPEGTRSPEFGLQPFGRGAARIALRSNCRILPVTIRCTPPALMKGQGLFDYPSVRLHFEVSISHAIYAKDLVNSEARPGVAARHLNAYLRTHFETALGYNVA